MTSQKETAHAKRKTSNDLYAAGVTCPANPSAIKTKDEYFRQKRCTFQVLVQGRFKEEVAAHKILTGGEFSKPFTDRPPAYLVTAGCKFFAHLTPGLELDMLCDEPYYVATLGGTVTTLVGDFCARVSVTSRLPPSYPPPTPPLTHSCTHGCTHSRTHS